MTVSYTHLDVYKRQGLIPVVKMMMMMMNKAIFVITNIFFLVYILFCISFLSSLKLYFLSFYSQLVFDGFLFLLKVQYRQQNNTLQTFVLRTLLLSDAGQRFPFNFLLPRPLIHVRTIYTNWGLQPCFIHLCKPYLMFTKSRLIHQRY